MPYGIPKKEGGDSKQNVKDMETCVSSVMKKGKSKDSAIVICKSSMFGYAPEGLSAIDALGAVTGVLTAAEWDTAYVNDLPDSSFAYVGPGGKKDGEGKTVPRSLRNLPYKDKDGKVDLPHLRNALARLDQTDIPDAAKKSALAKLRRAAKSAGVGTAQSATYYDTGDDLVEDVAVGVEVLHASRASLSEQNVSVIRGVVSVLNELVAKAEKDSAEATRLISSLFDPEIDPAIGDGVIVVAGDGTVALEAGERLGTYLARFRAERGLTAEEVAAKTSISTDAYMAIERGFNQYPPDDVVSEIAAVLGCDKAKAMQLRAMDREKPVMGY